MIEKISSDQIETFLTILGSHAIFFGLVRYLIFGGQGKSGKLSAVSGKDSNFPPMKSTPTNVPI